MRAKFQVQQVVDLVSRRYVDGKYESEASKYGEYILMFAVYAPDESDPNHGWWEATPSAQLSMQIDNPNAFGRLIVGDQVYVDVIKVHQ